MDNLSEKETLDKIEEMNRKKKEAEEEIAKLFEHLKSICVHPEEQVIETVYRTLQGEFHFYTGEEFYHKRICKACQDTEVCVTNSDEPAPFKKIKFAGSRTVYK